MQQQSQSFEDSNDFFEIIKNEEETYVDKKIKQFQEQKVEKVDKVEKVQFQKDNEQIKQLKLKENMEMDDRKVEVHDGDKQVDWYILENHTYFIKSEKYEENPTSVQRRFSDFEWLHEELIYHYPGYFIPPLPSKGIYSKIDPKIEFFNSKKNEFMQSRRQLLTLYLRQLLSHRELRYTKQLQIFLLDKNENSFTQEKNISKGLRQQKEKQQNEGLISNIMKQGFSFFNKVLGSEKIEVRVPDQYDQKFKDLAENYKNHYNKLKELSDCVNSIIEYKKSQAENMSNLSAVFSALKELDEIPQNLDKQVQKQGQTEVEQIKTLNHLINIPLQQQVGQLQQCIDILQQREVIANRVFEIQKQLDQLLQQMANESDLQDCQKTLDDQKKRMNQYIANFGHNEKYFLHVFNQNINNLTEQLNKHMALQNKEILQIWNQNELELK